MKYTDTKKSDIDLVLDYQTKNENQALEILLDRYSSLLRKLAHKHNSNYPHTIYEDCFQNAVYGAILALKRFNSKFDVKLITFLHSTVHFHLLSSNDAESFVSCPSNLREVKSYFSGKFSGERKKKFEQKHNLHNSQDIKSFEKKHLILSSNAICTSDELPEVETSSENDTITKVNVSLFLDKLSEEDKEIVCLLMEGYSISKVARIFSETRRKITDKQIKKKLQTMSEFFV